MTRYALRYKPDTDLGRRFTATSTGHFATRQAAEALRSATVAVTMAEVAE